MRMLGHHLERLQLQQTDLQKLVTDFQIGLIVVHLVQVIIMVHHLLRLVIFQLQLLHLHSMQNGHQILIV